MELPYEWDNVCQRDLGFADGIVQRRYPRRVHVRRSVSRCVKRVAADRVTVDNPRRARLRPAASGRLGLQCAVEKPSAGAVAASGVAVRQSGRGGSNRGGPGCSGRCCSIDSCSGGLALTETGTSAVGVGPGEHGLTDRQRLIALVLLCTAQLMAVLDISIVNIAIPTIQRELHLDTAVLQWLMTAYVLTFGGFLLVGGRLGDLYGRRRMLLIGLTLFTI